jgi:mRNA interferase RelE/StbE
MIYKLKFLPVAKQEWDKLNPAIKEQFKKKLAKRLENPEVIKDRLSGNLTDCYKIKLRNPGYRLVYKINKKTADFIVIAIGKREKFLVYQQAENRLAH